jgi:predicted hotdog family 3-hydroxylacyl-ACP dehydratase
MALLDAVLAWDGEHIHARCVSHDDPGNPLRRDGHLHAVHLCEVGAQAMALHGALVARDAGERARPGLLVALREVTLAREHVESLRGALDVRAERLLASADAWQYAFRVEHRGEPIVAGRAAVMYRGNA